MTNHTDEELKTAVLQSGGSYSIQDVSYRLLDGEAILTPAQLRAFASALRQQDLARMARMREEIAHYGAHDRNCAWCSDPVKDGATLCDCGFEEALSETSDIQEWMDGQRATGETILRSLLFASHRHDGSSACLYGDDGEMQCNVCWCDFKRDTPAELQRKIYYYNNRILAASLIAAPSARSTKGEGKSDAGAQMLMPRLLPESPLPPNPVRIDDKCNKEKR